MFLQTKFEPLHVAKKGRNCFKKNYEQVYIFLMQGALSILHFFLVYKNVISEVFKKKCLGIIYRYSGRFDRILRSASYKKTSLKTN